MCKRLRVFRAISFRAILNEEKKSFCFFQAIDRNKDGYITKGELKLAKKSIGMKDIDRVIKENDLDGDGRLDMEEFELSGGGKRK